jgi:hypothetical protein
MNNKISKQVKEIVDLWHKTVMGNIYECAKKQHEFSDMMWGLYNEIYGEDDGK